MKHSGAIFALALCACAATRPPEPETPREEIAQAVLGSTVKVEFWDSHGSGFFVAPGVVLTAAHVVDSWDIPRVRTRSGRTCQFVRGASLIGHDVAILWVDGCDDLPVLEIGPRPREGADVWLAGAPLDAEWSITRGVVTDADHELDDWGPVLVLDAVAHPGMSGGVTADDAGRAVGITVAIMTPDRRSWGGRSFSVPLDTIRESLDANGI